MPSRSAWSLLALLLSGCAVEHSRDHTPYATALEAAEANSATSVGQFYEIDFAERLSILLTTGPDRYLPCLRMDDPEPLDLVLLLDESGRVLEVGTRDGTANQRCFADAIAGEQFPPPPRGDYWTHVNLRGRRALPDDVRD